MALTLIKSGIEPNPTTDQEEHDFTYALYPHAEGWRAAGTVAESYKLNQPLKVEMNAQDKEEHRFCFAEVQAPNIVIETIKRAEDGNGTIIRMYESENALTRTKITVNTEFTKAYICNLLEQEMQEAEVNGKEVSLLFKPYEIVTLELV